MLPCLSKLCTGWPECWNSSAAAAKPNVLCVSDMFLLAKLAHLKCFEYLVFCNTSTSLVLALVGMVLDSTSSSAWGREECSDALVLPWYTSDWWMGLFWGTKLTVLTMSWFVHLLCTSCTHYQWLTLVLVLLGIFGIYLCLLSWDRIIGFYFFFPWGRER